MQTLIRRGMRTRKIEFVEVEYLRNKMIVCFELPGFNLG